LDQKIINGFSKLSKEEKIAWLSEVFIEDANAAKIELLSFWHCNEHQQKIFDGFSENTISNFFMPYGIAPNFLIDGRVYAVPMVIEESSVVAAAAAAAKFWLDRGGFRTEVQAMEKIGQVHFKWKGGYELLNQLSDDLISYLRDKASPHMVNMEKRGGGLLRIEFLDFTDQCPNLYQLRAYFDTKDSMGANFINTILECFATAIEDYLVENDEIPDEYRDIQIIMSILSNYTPGCTARAWVSCPIEELGSFPNNMSSEEFAEKFYTAVEIARIDRYRATTHNKGIYNGIDAVVLATGNDFRAIEAAGHTYACRDGQYRSLSSCRIDDGIFYFELEVPLAIGTVGGLTSLHPLAKRSLEILGNPSAEQLMRIIASVGLAQNFAAVRSLVTTGIQQGHMKMHLLNILNHLGASDDQKNNAILHFSDKIVSFASVREFLEVQ
jgi:hydroxymethylglutaryl-CoA reductase